METSLLGDHLFLCSQRFVRLGVLANDVLATTTWKRLVPTRVILLHDVYRLLENQVTSCNLAWPPPLQSLQLTVEKCHRFLELVALVCQETAQHVEKRSLTQHVNSKLVVVLMNYRSASMSLLFTYGTPTYLGKQIHSLNNLALWPSDLDKEA